MKTNIYNDNELITKFMGWSSFKTEYDTFWHSKQECTLDIWEFHNYNLYFHTSWEWLMPVVEKISKIRCCPDSEIDNDTFYPRTFGMINSETKQFMVRINRFPLHQSDSLLEATYSAVLEFIKWYNEQPK